MDEETRSLILIPGRCSFCGRPAEQHAISRRWWHTDESCKPAYAIAHAGDIPVGPLGFAAIWPARFEQKPPITLPTAARKTFGGDR